MARLAVVSVCLNDENVLPLFLNNMQEWAYHDFEFFVVDNGSDDHSLDLVKSSAKQARIIPLGKNLSTTGGYNHAIREILPAGFDYVMLLALDVLLAPDCIPILLEEMDRQPDIGVIGPILLKSHDRNLIECMGFTVKRDFSFCANFVGMREPIDLPELLDSDYIDGGTSLFRLSALKQTGLLDELLFMYGEDVDICLRLREQGYRVVATSKARAWHRHTEIRTADPRPRPWQVFYQHRNQVYLARKHRSLAGQLAFAAGLVRRMPRLLAYYAIRQRSLRLVIVYLESLLHGAVGRMGKTKYVR